MTKQHLGHIRGDSMDERASYLVEIIEDAEQQMDTVRSLVWSAGSLLIGTEKQVLQNLGHATNLVELADKQIGDLCESMARMQKSRNSKGEQRHED